MTEYDFRTLHFEAKFAGGDICCLLLAKIDAKLAFCIYQFAPCHLAQKSFLCMEIFRPIDSTHG